MDTNSSEGVFRRIDAQFLDQWIVVRLLDRKLIDKEQIEAYQHELLSLLKYQRSMILDFSLVEFYSSRALIALILLQKALARQDRRFVLCSVRPEIVEVFRITRLTRIFWIARSATEAMFLMTSRQLGFNCPFADCGHEILIPSQAFMANDYRARCPVCETEFQLDMRDGMAADQVHVSAFKVAAYAGHDLTVSAFGRDNERPNAPFEIKVEGICELYLAEILERAIRTLPVPRLVILNLVSLQELTPRAAARIESVAVDIESDGMLVARDQSRLLPRPFRWPAAIPLFESIEDAHHACSSGKALTPLIVRLTHVA